MCKTSHYAFHTVFQRGIKSKVIKLIKSAAGKGKGRSRIMILEHLVDKKLSGSDWNNLLQQNDISTQESLDLVYSLLFDAVTFRAPVLNQQTSSGGRNWLQERTNLWPPALCSFPLFRNFAVVPNSFPGIVSLSLLLNWSGMEQDIILPRLPYVMIVEWLRQPGKPKSSLVNSDSMWLVTKELPEVSYTQSHDLANVQESVTMTNLNHSWATRPQTWIISAPSLQFDVVGLAIHVEPATSTRQEIIVLKGNLVMVGQSSSLPLSHICIFDFPILVCLL